MTVETLRALLNALLPETEVYIRCHDTDQINEVQGKDVEYDAVAGRLILKDRYIPGA